jgi:hypothetical protein
MMCEMPRVHRWRSVQFDAESAFKLELKNNGVVRRSSQESDVSTIFSSGALFQSQYPYHGFCGFPQFLINYLAVCCFFKYSVNNTKCISYLNLV